MQRYGFASAPISNGGYNNYFIIASSAPDFQAFLKNLMFPLGRPIFKHINFSANSPDKNTRAAFCYTLYIIFYARSSPLVRITF